MNHTECTKAPPRTGNEVGRHPCKEGLCTDASGSHYQVQTVSCHKNAVTGGLYPNCPHMYLYEINEEAQREDQEWCSNSYYKVCLTVHHNVTATDELLHNTFTHFDYRSYDVPPNVIVQSVIQEIPMGIYCQDVSTVSESWRKLLMMSIHEKSTS